MAVPNTQTILNLYTRIEITIINLIQYNIAEQIFAFKFQD